MKAATLRANMEKIDEAIVADEKNPNFLFQGTYTEILCAIVNGTIDPVIMARRELDNRGLDNNGFWVGFRK